MDEHTYGRTGQSITLGRGIKSARRKVISAKMNQTVKHISNVTLTTRRLKLPFVLQKSAIRPIFQACRPHTSDLALKFGNQCHGMLKYAELRQWPIKHHVHRHHATKFRERVVDVAHSYPNGGRIKNQEIHMQHATLQQCGMHQNIYTLCPNKNWRCRVSSFLTWCTVITSKISDKNDKFLSNYSYLFSGLLFIGTQCISHTRITQHEGSCTGTNSYLWTTATFCH